MLHKRPDPTNAMIGGDSSQTRAPWRVQVKGLTKICLCLIGPPPSTSILKAGLSLPVFIYFRLFNTVESKQVNKCSTWIFLMTGFEPQSSVKETTALPTARQPLPSTSILPYRLSVIMSLARISIVLCTSRFSSCRMMIEFWPKRVNPVKHILCLEWREFLGWKWEKS